MKTRYDYTNQAWTAGGLYLDCGHPAAGTVMGAGSPAPGERFQSCRCYGRAHAGEAGSADIVAGMTDPHAKRRLADGRNSWRKMALTPGAQERFVDWLLDNGLTQALRMGSIRPSPTVEAIVHWALSEHQEAVGDHLDLSDEELLALKEEVGS